VELREAFLKVGHITLDEGGDGERGGEEGHRVLLQKGEEGCDDGDTEATKRIRSGNLFISLV
jgi:hypothetical protein